jgi:hypothetical protein
MLLVLWRGFSQEEGASRLESSSVMLVQSAVGSPFGFCVVLTNTWVNIVKSIFIVLLNRIQVVRKVVCVVC